MRKIVSSLFISLDGVVESPDKWSLDYFTDEIGASIGAVMGDADAMLLGRATYEGFAAHWPQRTVEDDEGAPFMNSTRKYVASTTLSTVEWENSVLLEGELSDAVRELKAGDGGDIMTSGSPSVVRYLLAHGLLDHLHLLLYPVVVGAGTRLFGDDGTQFALKLSGSKTFDNGVLELNYTPNR
ncbi:dihydrofolate reductase family protein [Amycolatopsis sp. CA-230715]|uniref:dihydrofolate reductase family protein n=1 Tax=Amycolatopsis sp. CA-230715 TaxID=2745196 RepID=UPI001C0146C4|nr:dihydrofolate reductase family protein [Amycolatopsis sp. CA-230715]QWF81208.1 putative protein YyaP [Amycolatopsis sp. CA-230715]